MKTTLPARLIVALMFMSILSTCLRRADAQAGVAMLREYALECVRKAARGESFSRAQFDLCAELVPSFKAEKDRRARASGRPAK